MIQFVVPLIWLILANVSNHVNKILKTLSGTPPSKLISICDILHVQMTKNTDIVFLFTTFTIFGCIYYCFLHVILYSLVVGTSSLGFSTQFYWFSLYFALCTLHSVLYILHFSLCNFHFSLCTLQYSSCGKLQFLFSSVFQLHWTIVAYYKILNNHIEPKKLQTNFPV